MSKSLSKLPLVLKDIDLVIEARDARLPLTSINPAFEDVLQESWGRASTAAGPSGWKGKGKEKLVVYTKRDQAEERFEEVSLQKGFIWLIHGHRSSIQSLCYRVTDLDFVSQLRLARKATQKGVQETRQPVRPLCRHEERQGRP